MINLLNYSRSDLAAFLKEQGEAPYRATQLLKWIHQLGETDFLNMSNLSLSLRKRLSEIACIKIPTLVKTLASQDGTYKWLLKLECGNSIETVFIPEKNRGTLCVSSQIGCGLTCSFCSTAKQGFNRNLTTAEIIGQVWFATRFLAQDTSAKSRLLQKLATESAVRGDLAHRTAVYTQVHEDSSTKSTKQCTSVVEFMKQSGITNVVMMGMGEPLLNFNSVVAAMDLMMDDFAYGLSKRRVTLSTSGLVPQMEWLKQTSPVALAVSLHAPNDALRDTLVPINKKYPLHELMQTCKNYFPRESRRRVTFEYVMLKGINDSLKEAKELEILLKDIPSKINLIPFNPFPYSGYERSAEDVIFTFRDYLLSKSINTIVRKTRGEDIDAACGQLAGLVQDKTSRSKKWQQLKLKF